MSAPTVDIAAVVMILPTAPVSAEERCCFNNFRFAGGCMVVVRGDETCQDVLAYLNNFNSVGKYYCDNTVIRGGWSLGPCGDPAVNTSPYVAPENAQPGPPAQEVTGARWSANAAALEEDLMSGDTVIAPAGSEVQFRIAPTSYWTDGGGDAFEIQATAVKVGDELIPLDQVGQNEAERQA